MRLRFLIALLLLSPVPAMAGVTTISSPNVSEGAFSIEFGNGWGYDGGDTFQHEIELGYAPTHYWKTELELVGERDGGESLRYASTTLKNMLRVTRQDQGELVTGAVRLDYTHAHRGGDADEVEVRFLAQRNEGLFSAVGNVGFIKEVGGNADGGLQAKARGGLRYQITEWARPAIEYFGSYGALSDMPGYSEQSHQLGVASKFALTDTVALEVGYLAGISADAPDHAAKLNMEYVF